MDARKRAAGRVAAADCAWPVLRVEGMNEPRRCSPRSAEIAGLADQVRAAVLRRWSRPTTWAASRPTPRRVAEEMLR